MTTEAHAAQDHSGPSIHVVRARKLLLGGLIGGLIASVACLMIFTVVYGSRGLASAGLAAAMVLVFYGIGQYVMVLFADAGARLLMMVSLASYTLRILMLGLVLWSYNRNRADWPSLVPMGIFITTIVVVVGWLTVEVFVFSRLRIGIYDTEYVEPSKGDEAE